MGRAQLPILRVSDLMVHPWSGEHPDYRPFQVHQARRMVNVFMTLVDEGVVGLVTPPLGPRHPTDVVFDCPLPALGRLHLGRYSAIEIDIDAVWNGSSRATPGIPGPAWLENSVFVPDGWPTVSAGDRLSRVPAFFDGTTMCLAPVSKT